MALFLLSKQSLKVIQLVEQFFKNLENYQEKMDICIYRRTLFRLTLIFTLTTS